MTIFTDDGSAADVGKCSKNLEIWCCSYCGREVQPRCTLSST
jgi:hypothetical protein